MLEFLRRSKVTGHYQKIPPVYLRKKLLAVAGNFKVNKQTNYKSVPIFFIPSYREKARNTELVNF